MSRREIEEVLRSVDVVRVIGAGFVAYSQGRAVVPPPGEMVFRDPPGDVHVKYGYLVGDEYFVVKVASGFYDNPKLGLPSSNGLMLLFDLGTGQPRCVLLDEGYLTDVRTAATGAIAARHLAPREVRRIGVLGAGTQAKLQLCHLKTVTNCRSLVAWSRDEQRLARYGAEMGREGFSVRTTLDVGDVAACDLIVTTTPATTPLIFANRVNEGTHITAVGSDTPDKQELDPALLARADLVVADAIVQCTVRGEISHALRAGLLEKGDITDLGNVVAGRSPGRTSPQQMTVADLTGLAVQDLQIAKAVHAAISSADDSLTRHPPTEREERGQ